ncbi:MAG: DUF86 domain-containing protein [Actinobacteria bacterium]|nr:DUF86 domain-containing protein [Actinomycetota bacterium]MBU4489934.1 DUF86 domain-containing protein [Actinomycetota bacterium]MCG2794366.1 DUF86 domain-containing protein [Actinomycetes bacterium]
MRKDPDRLMDILEAIERIDRYTGEGRNAFQENELIQTWTVHHLQIIGEAARKVSEGLREAHPEVPWKQLVAMRNILVHDYFAVDEERVWAVVQNELPKLKGQIEAIASSM